MIGIEDEKRSGGESAPPGVQGFDQKAGNDPTTIVTTEEKSPLDFALRYARNGWRIFPLKAEPSVPDQK